jgi:cytochrome b
MHQPDAHQPATTLRVWDPLVRLFHWALVVSFATAWVTSSSRDDTHQWLGLAAAALIAARLAWGFVGAHYARFAQFIRTPNNILSYLLAILRGTEARYIGHNPAGGIMVLALLAGVFATGLTGWLMTTDAWFGDETMQTVHSLCANGMLLLILLHMGGVIVASVRHKENLVKAMITGNKRQPQDNDVS